MPTPRSSPRTALRAARQHRTASTSPRTAVASANVPRAPSKAAKAAAAKPARTATARAWDLRTQAMVFRPTGRILDAFKPKSPLQRLIDNPPSLAGQATRFSDGRNIKVVIAHVRDAVGNTAPGVLVQLRSQDDDTLLDHTRTNRKGIAVLRFPMLESFSGDLPAAVVQVLGPDLLETLPVVPVDGAQYALAEAVVPALPAALAGDPGDPYTRIPADFTPDMCDAMDRILGDWDDPLLENLDAPDDFRSRRTRLIKRFIVPRVGEEKDPYGAPKRYLVHMRQEWMFLGYTLGELQEVEGLDPGQVLDETTRTATRTTSRIARSAVNDFQQTLAEVQDTLSRASSVDTLVDVATSLHASTDAGASLRVSGGGGFLGIPGLFGVGGGAASTSTRAWLRNSVLTNATTRTSTDTSLMVNSMLRSAQTRVNRTVRTAANTLRSLTGQVVSSVDQVSPLLSRVTNLLRWTVYENYAVCTRVEDVVELQAIEVLEEQKPGDLFSAEDIVEYQPYLEPWLLHPDLRGRFTSIRRAVEHRRAAERPVTAIRFTVDHACQWVGADLRIRCAGEDIVIPLRPRTRSASGYLRFPEPVDEEDLGAAELELTLRSDRIGIPGLPFDRMRATVTRIRMTYGPGLHDAESFDGLTVTGDAPLDRADVPLRVPTPHVFPEHDPLYLHINRNPRHYLGVLLQAALELPSLRDDCRLIRDLFPGDHPVWRLPIAGFEGDRILVVGDVGEKDRFAKRLREDRGAGTVVQIAAPGAYSEALQGLLQLTDAAGQIHPQLLPTPAPRMPPLALVDLQGRTLQVLEGDAVRSFTSAADGVDGDGATGATDGITEGVPVPGTP